MSTNNKVFQLGDFWFFVDMEEWEPFEESGFITVSDYPKGNWSQMYPWDIEGPFRSKEDAEAGLVLATPPPAEERTFEDTMARGKKLLAELGYSVDF
jgi:hypothetical protein